MSANNFNLRQSKFGVLLPALTVVFVEGALAQRVNVSNFYYRDYLDFGQNKGGFKPGAKDLTLTNRTNTDSYTFPHGNDPFPSFEARSVYGSLTSLGGGYAVTANHVSLSSLQQNEEKRKFGQTVYNPDENNSKNDIIESSAYGSDVKFVRFSRYIVEGEAELTNPGITEHSFKQVKDGETNTNKTKEDENIQKLKEYLEKGKDDDGNVYLYQAGSGALKLVDASGVLLGPPQDASDGENLTGKDMRGGSIHTYNPNGTGLGYANLLRSSPEQTNNHDRGISMVANVNSGFRNAITTGDSGSGFYFYDKETQSWKLLGVTSQLLGRNQSTVAFVSDADLKHFKETGNKDSTGAQINGGKFEKEIDLQNKDDWKIQTQLQLTSGNESETLTQGTDLVFKNGGKIEVKANLYRIQSGLSGGFIFKGGNSASDIKTYKIENLQERGDQDPNIKTTYATESSGLDIEENAIVEWHLRNMYTDEKRALHKIGKGTLVIKTEYDPMTDKGQKFTQLSGNNNQFGYLRLGDGLVKLDTSKQAFDGIYITSGRPTLELVEGKLEAIGAVKDTISSNSKDTASNSYTLTQATPNNMGIYFGNNGGDLDLKGNSLSLNALPTNDYKGNVINSNSSTASNLTFKGNIYNTAKDGGDASNANPSDYIYHGSIGMNLTSDSIRKENDNDKDKNNNINIVQKESSIASHNIVFDGHINAKKLEMSNSKITLQGHPTTHAVVNDESLRKKIEEAEKKVNDVDLPDYMDLSRPSTLKQPDWDTRSFKFKDGITLDGNSELNIGRNSILEADITVSQNSKLNFGGTTMKHFIDKYDGSNTSGNGFTFRQEVSSESLEEKNRGDETISYKGKITATGATISSSALFFEAGLDLKSNAKLMAKYLTLTNDKEVKLDNSTIELNNLIFKGVSDTSKITKTGTSKITVKDGFGFDGVSNVDLDSIDSGSKIDSKPADYDIFASNKSSITGTSKDLSANITLSGGSTLTLKSLKLEDKNTKSEDTQPQSTMDNEEKEIKNTIDPSKVKSLVMLDGDGTSLTLSEDLTAKNLSDRAAIVASNKASVNARKIDFNEIGEAVLLLNKEAKITTMDGISISSDKSIVSAVESRKSDTKEEESKPDTTIKGSKSLVSLIDKSSITNTGKDLKLEASGANILSLSAESSITTGKLILTGKDSLINVVDKSTLTTSDNLSIAPKDSSISGSSDANNYTTSFIALDKESKIEAKSLEAKNTIMQVKLDDKSNLKTTDDIKINNSNNNPTVISVAFDLDKESKLESKNLESNALFNMKLAGGSNVKIIEDLNLTNINSNGSTKSNSTDTLEDTESTSSIAIGATSSIEIKTLKLNNHNLEIKKNADDKVESENVKEESKPKLTLAKLDIDNSTFILKDDMGPLSFDIDAKNSSNIYISNFSFGNGKTITANSSDGKTSKFTFDTLNYTAQASSTAPTAINADISVTKSLGLKEVGKKSSIGSNSSSVVVGSSLASSLSTTKADEVNHVPPRVPMTDDVLKAGDENRFHALKIGGTNTGNTLTFDTNSKLTVEFDDSVNLDDNSIKYNNFYTLLSATKIDDKRTDKRIDFKFKDENKKLYVTSQIRDGKIQLSFTKDDPKSLSELSKHTQSSKSNEILEALLQHNPNDDFIDSAVNTNNYKLLNTYISGIEDNMQNIIDSNDSRVNSKLLFSNNDAINSRVSKVKYNSYADITRLNEYKLASIDKALSLKLILDAIKKNKLRNNVWLNAGGGYFRENSTSDMYFYGTNLGYDNTIAINDSTILLGVMAGFGISNYKSQAITNNSKYYSVGLYMDSSAYANEFQSNINFSYMDSLKNMQVNVAKSITDKARLDSVKNNSMGVLWSNYYKYSFSIGESNNYKHYLKPVLALDLEFNNINGFESDSYKQKTLNNIGFDVGGGLEYSVVGQSSVYTLQFLTKDNVWNMEDKMFLSFSNSQKFIGYELNSKALNFQLNFNGFVALPMNFAIQYAASALADINGSIGGRGDIKFEYRF